MMKKLVLALLLMFCITASAYAAVNDVYVRTENPVITKGACSQAGALSLTFDNGTTITGTNGTEVIGRLSPSVTLCQPIDFFVRVPNGNYTSKTNGTVQGDFNAIDGSANAGVVFRVTGTVGSDTITITPLNGTLNATSSAGVRGMKVVLFNVNNAPGELLDATKISFNSTNGEFYNSTDDPIVIADLDNPNATFQATAVQNSLCILAPADYANHEVLIYLESAPKVYTFLQPNNVIAVVGTKPPVSLYPEKAKLLAELPSSGDQGTASGCDKDYENATGMCGKPYDTGKFGHFAVQTGVDFPAGVYEVEMEILVNGATGDNGAYFGEDTEGLQLSATTTPLTAAFAATGNFTVTNRFLGNTNPTLKTPVLGCVRDDDQKITRMVGTVTLSHAQVKDIRFMRFNVPSIAVPGVKAGDVVSLSVTVRQGRCSVIFSGERDLFTIVAKCPTTVTPGALFFPYFAGTDDGYWNGIALVNPSATDVNATLNIVEVNGNKAELTVTVPAEGMFVRLVEALSLEPGFAPDAGNTVPMGAARSYITVKGSGLSGFAMMADGAQSMGYVVD